MEHHEKIIALLTEIKENQVKARQIQEEQLALTKSQWERSFQNVNESIKMQRTALKRHALVTKILIPCLVILFVILTYIMFK